MENRLRPDQRALFVISLLAVLAISWAVTAQTQDPSQREALQPEVTPSPEEQTQSELHRAAQAGQIALLRIHLSQGMHPDARDKAQRTPLMEAVKTGQIEAVRLLLSAGADVNASSSTGRTPLIEAAEFGQAHSASLLIAAGADLNASQRGWGTPLEAAERTGNNEIAAMLRSAGARSSGRSVGDTVCVRPWQGNGYCGVVEEVNKTSFRLRVTELIGCADGCQAIIDCSANRMVGGAEGIQVGESITTVSWCLTHTAVKQ
jgi:uncharacterized protein